MMTMMKKRSGNSSKAEKARKSDADSSSHQKKPGLYLTSAFFCLWKWSAQTEIYVAKATFLPSEGITDFLVKNRHSDKISKK